MGDFSQLEDDAAELLSGGVGAGQTRYPGGKNTVGGSNYGQYKKLDPSAVNPSRRK